MSCWHSRGGFNNCPFAVARGQVQELEKRHIEQETALAEAVRGGDEHAFGEAVREYGLHVRRARKRYFFPGGDREDVHQEAMVGLFHAVKTFDPLFGRTLAEHVSMCVRNSVVRAVRAHTRKKHRVLSDSVDLKDVHPAAASWDPLKRVESRLVMEAACRTLSQSLSSLEMTSLVSRVRGDSVKDIGRRAGVSPKQIENALFRARQKAREALMA
ncbi:MAG: sigma-70 family RNA polymerase sigma factor [Candidatus Eremiobacterota bacterium]